MWNWLLRDRLATDVCCVIVRALTYKLKKLYGADLSAFKLDNITTLQFGFVLKDAQLSKWSITSLLDMLFYSYRYGL